MPGTTNPSSSGRGPAERGRRAADDSLPVDSDIEVEDASAGAPPRPVHLRWRHIGVVALGGAIGTGAREALSLIVPSEGPFPVAVFSINVSGAFVLGVVLEALLRLGPDQGRRRMLRLLVGTGFLGGYTTYSALAVGVAQLFDAGQAWLGVLYGALSLVAGAAASLGGIAVGARVSRRRVGASGGGR